MAALFDENRKWQKHVTCGYFLKFFKAMFNLLSSGNVYFELRKDECVKKKNLHEENYLFLVVCQIPSSNGAGSLKKVFFPHSLSTDDCKGGNL